MKAIFKNFLIYFAKKSTIHSALIPSFSSLKVVINKNDAENAYHYYPFQDT